jgi:hypothetical protein
MVAAVRVEVPAEQVEVVVRLDEQEVRALEVRRHVHDVVEVRADDDLPLPRAMARADHEAEVQEHPARAAAARL